MVKAVRREMQTEILFLTAFFIDFLRYLLRLGPEMRQHFGTRFGLVMTNLSNQAACSSCVNGKNVILICSVIDKKNQKKHFVLIKANFAYPYTCVMST